jgi:hypothetical protein
MIRKIVKPLLKTNVKEQAALISEAIILSLA